MIKEFWRNAVFQPLFTRPLHKKRRLSISRDPQSLTYCCKKPDNSENHTGNEWHRSPPAPNIKRATAPRGCPDSLGENSKYHPAGNYIHILFSHSRKSSRQANSRKEGRSPESIGLCSAGPSASAQEHLSPGLPFSAAEMSLP